MSIFTFLNVKKRPVHFISVLFGFTLISATAYADVSISEFHYDNVGADVGEAIKLSGPAGTNLNGWSLLLYNGTGGAIYNSLAVEGELIAGENCDQGQWLIQLPVNGLQNGSPDGIALVDNLGTVIEFISYEGEFTATNGAAQGMQSIDVGVTETSTTPEGFSIQKINGVWQAQQPNTFTRCTKVVDPIGTAQVVKIHQIQGEGDSIAVDGLVEVEAIVTATYLSTQKLNGFFIQEEDADADANVATSEAIFVYCPSCSNIAVGDKVKVKGTAADYFNMSQITATTVDVIAANQPLPQVRIIDMPVGAMSESEINAAYEAFEGMLVSVRNELTVTETYNLGRYGEILLSANGRLRQYTDANIPTPEGFVAHNLENQSRSIILDDGSSQQNVSPVAYPKPYLSQNNYIRGGDTINNLTGILHFAFSSWRIQPLETGFDYAFSAKNIRPLLPPQVNAPLKIASFNVLNYFTTLDIGMPVCGPTNTMDCRGANSAEEFNRQQQKIVEAICQLDADVVGLMEIQNSSSSEISALEYLVAAVNEKCGGYTPVLTGPLGSDAITVAMVYRAASVAAIGKTATLNSQAFVNPNVSAVDKNRPALAQSFRDLKTKTDFTVVVNHLKSKGSSCNESQNTNDDDALSGQGNCNGTRTKAVAAQLQWLATKPTTIDTQKIVIIGDLNSYRNESPITTFTSAGFTDLVDYFGGDEAYSYVFNGEWGYLDHALASEALLPSVVNTLHWNINADESPLFDYNSEYKPTNYLTELFSANPFRSSDHDAVIVGLMFEKQKILLSSITAFFDQAVKVGDLKGAGNFGIIQKLNAGFFKLLLASAQYFEVNNVSASCAIIQSLSTYSDGKSRPQDTLTGKSLPLLYGQLTEYLGDFCQ